MLFVLRVPGGNAGAPQEAASKRFLYLVVRHKDRTAGAVVSAVKQAERMIGGARSGKEVKDEGAGAGMAHGTDGVPYSIERLGEGKGVGAAQDGVDKAGSMVARAVLTTSPDGVEPPIGTYTLLSVELENALAVVFGDYLPLVHQVQHGIAAATPSALNVVLIDWVDWYPAVDYGKRRWLFQRHFGSDGHGHEGVLIDVDSVEHAHAVLTEAFRTPLAQALQGVRAIIVTAAVLLDLIRGKGASAHDVHSMRKAVDNVLMDGRQVVAKSAAWVDDHRGDLNIKTGKYLGEEELKVSSLVLVDGDDKNAVILE